MFTILHCADLHLEASFASDGVPPAVGNWRRADLHATVGRIMALAREHRVDAVTIAGDLYEHEYALPDTVELLREQLGALAPTPVFIAPGEHDPYGDDSLYALCSWPANVTIMPPGRPTCLELEPGLSLWGAGYAPGADPDILDGFKVDRKGAHLLLLHASLDPVPAGEGPYHVDARSLRAAGIDLALLGHKHRGEADRSTANYVYPGSPEPLCEQEADGDHLAVLVQVDDGTCTTRALPVSQWRFRSVQVDLSGSSTIEEAAALIRVALREAGVVDERSFCRLALVGVRRFDLDLEALAALVETPAYVRFDVKQSIPFSVEQLAYEATLRGQLVRRVRERLAGTPSGEHARYLSALSLGLRALEGKQVRPNESG